MFLFRADRYLEELEANEPEILDAVRAAVAEGKEDGALTLAQVEGAEFFKILPRLALLSLVSAFYMRVEIFLDFVLNK